MMRPSSPKRIQVDTSSPNIQKKFDPSSSYHIQTYSPHRRSPLARSYSGEKTLSPKSFDHQPSPSMTKTEELLFEDTFRGTLGGLKKILLHHQSQHDFSGNRDPGLEDRAQEIVNEEVRRTITKMRNLQSGTLTDSMSHKIAAYSFIAAQLCSEIEQSLDQQEAASLLEKLREEHDQLVQQYQSLQKHSSYENAVSEQKILMLEQENKALKEQLSLVSRKKGTLVFELETRNRMEDDAHAKYVNLHIQIVNYHTKITQLMASLEASVRTRIGFVPRDVQQNIEKVRQLPAPGADILYTRRRSHQRDGERGKEFQELKSPSARGQSPHLQRSKSLDFSPKSPGSEPDSSPGLGPKVISPSIENMSQQEFYNQLLIDPTRFQIKDHKSPNWNRNLNGMGDDTERHERELIRSDSDHNSVKNITEKYEKYLQKRSHSLNSLSMNSSLNSPSEKSDAERVNIDSPPFEKSEGGGSFSSPSPVPYSPAMSVELRRKYPWDTEPSSYPSPIFATPSGGGKETEKW